MVVRIDGDQLEGGAGGLASVHDVIDGHKLLATSFLASIGRWSDRSTVDRLLTEACDILGWLSSDHMARCEIATQLDNMSWAATSQPPMAQPAVVASEQHPTEVDADIEDLERRISELNSAPYFTGKGQAIVALRQQLRDARLARMAELVERYQNNLSGYYARDYLLSIRSAIAEEAAALGLTAEGFAAAAQAMVDGVSPDGAGLDPLLFPQSYVEAHADWTRLTRERDTLEDALDQAWLRLYDSHGGDTAFEDYVTIAALLDLVETTLNDRYPDGAGVELLTSASYLDGLILLTGDASSAALGGFLGHTVDAGFGDPDTLSEVGAVVSATINTPNEAAALFNAIPREMLPILPVTAYEDLYGTIETMAPFAEALALASHSDSLRVTGADLVGEFSEPQAFNWFVGVQYNPAFLEEVAIAQAEVSSGDVYMPWTLDTYYDHNGTQISMDARVLVAQGIADSGYDHAASLVGELADRGLLGGYVDPASGYGDGGAEAGRILALLGTEIDRAASVQVAEVMAAVGQSSAQPGVLEGAALMVGPHLPALLTETHGGDLERTPLAGLVEPEGETIHAFLAEVLADNAATEIVFSLAAMHLAASLDANIDSTDPTSISATTAGYGELVDLLVEVSMDENLADAERRDHINGIMQNVFGFVIDLAVAGGLAVGIPALAGALALGGPAVIALTVAGEVGGAGVTNIAIPSVTDFGLSTDNVEDLLKSGYSLENAIVYEARRLVFAHLHAAGVIELPSEWFEDGELGPLTESQWEAFDGELRAQFPTTDLYYEWLAQANQIGGAIDWEPNSN